MLAIFDRERLGRAWPLLVVAVIGQVSAALPPGPTDLAKFWASTALLVVSSALVVARSPLDRVAWPLWGGLYVASVVLAMLATGGTGGGLGALLLIPVVGVAVYGRPWESAAVVAAVIIGLVWVSLAGPDLPAAVVRRGFLFGAIGATVSVAIHVLRDRLGKSNERTTRLLRQAQTINAAAEQLATLIDPLAIAALGAELAGHIAASPGSEIDRAAYLRLDDRTLVLDAQFNRAGPPIEAGWSVDDHPALRQAIGSRRPVVATLQPGDAAPPLQALLLDGEATHLAWVPVCPEGSVHGVLAIASRAGPIGTESVERCVALGHLLELALSNWAAHQRLKQQATAEERRRIARELHDGLAHELAFIASRTRRSSRPGIEVVDSRELAHAADRALDEARRAITVLSSTEPQSLTSALAQTAEDLADRFGVELYLDLADDVDMPGEITENMLRIVREAMTNAASHANPSRLTVRLHNSSGIRLVVEDDGCGFDPCDRRPNGFGLLSMEERAASIGAEFSVDSSRSRGTRIEVAIP